MGKGTEKRVRPTPTDTAGLIARMAAAAGPVRPLRPVWQQVLGWLLAAFPVLALAVWLMGPRADLAEALTTPRYLIEQGAALATVITSAIAALILTRPGRDLRLAIAPAAPGAVWMGSLGAGCVADWIRRGPDGLMLTPELECFLYISVIGLVPAALLLGMLRKGAPLAPRATLFLAVLAAAALGNFGLRLFHAQDGAFMVVIWQMGSVAVLAGLAGLAGPRLLRWQHEGTTA